MTGIYIGKGLKAWSNSDSDYYTESATPSVGDKILNADGSETGKTVSAISDGYIEYNDPWRLTITNIDPCITEVALGDTVYNMTPSNPVVAADVNTDSIYFYWRNSGGGPLHEQNCTITEYSSDGWIIGGIEFEARQLVTIVDKTTPSASFDFMLPP